MVLKLCAVNSRSIDYLLAIIVFLLILSASVFSAITALTQSPPCDKNTIIFNMARHLLSYIKKPKDFIKDGSQR